MRKRPRHLTIVALAVLLLATGWLPALATVDPLGDIYPKVLAYDGKFHVFYHIYDMRVEPRIGNYKNIYDIKGRLIHTRIKYADGDLALADQRRKDESTQTASKRRADRRLRWGKKTCLIRFEKGDRGIYFSPHNWIIDGKKEQRVNYAPGPLAKAYRTRDAAIIGEIICFLVKSATDRRPRI